MPSIKIDLSNKVALVTGGTRGIGLSIAQRLHDAGATVIITGTSEEEIKKLNNENLDSRKIYLDVNFLVQESISLFLDKLERFNHIDILINNAGVNRIDKIVKTTDEDFDLVMKVNLKGTYTLIREVGKKMSKNNYGRIVNISSIWGHISRPGRSLYSSSKFAVNGLTKAVSLEFAEDNILVNSVGPGFTETELTFSTNTTAELKKISSLIPLKRMAKPIEIANLVVFLASNLNTYITGQNILIDGGYTNE